MGSLAIAALIGVVGGTVTAVLGSPVQFVLALVGVGVVAAILAVAVAVKS